MDLEKQKKIMLEQHLIERNIVNRDVLDAMSKVKREIFVPRDKRAYAYDDNPLPIGCNQTISQPFIVAYMTQHLELSSEHEVLEIGTGCGYQTAILAKIAKHIYTVERYKELSMKARENLNFLGIENVTYNTGDGTNGFPEYAPFDRIMVTAAPQKIPEKLVEQLKPGGIMVLPVGKIGGVQELLQVHKTDDGYKKKHLTYVRFVPLISEE